MAGNFGKMPFPPAAKGKGGKADKNAARTDAIKRRMAKSEAGGKPVKPGGGY
jgi:hypothetical protein